MRISYIQLTILIVTTALYLVYWLTSYTTIRTETDPFISTSTSTSTSTISTSTTSTSASTSRSRWRSSSTIAPTVIAKTILTNPSSQYIPFHLTEWLSHINIKSPYSWPSLHSLTIPLTLTPTSTCPKHDYDSTPTSTSTSTCDKTTPQLITSIHTCTSSPYFCHLIRTWNISYYITLQHVDQWECEDECEMMKWSMRKDNDNDGDVERLSPSTLVTTTHTYITLLGTLSHPCYNVAFNTSCHGELYPVLTADVRQLVKKMRSVKQVYILSQFWSDGYAHFMTESLPRLMVDYIHVRENKDIMIHVMQRRNQTLIGSPFISDILSFLGISPSRVIDNTLHAHHVILPDVGSCGSINPIHMRALSQVVKIAVLHGIMTCHVTRINMTHVDMGTYGHQPWLGINMQRQHRVHRLIDVIAAIHHITYDLGIHEPSIITRFGPYIPSLHIIIMQRTHTRRILSLDEIITSIHTRWPTAYITVLSEPQLRFAHVMLLLASTHILISPHGAGLSSMIAMSRHTTVIEILAHPINIMYSRLARALELHYYGYAPKHAQHHGTISVDIKKWEIFLKSVKDPVLRS